MRPDDSLEQAARKRGYALVCGCDEAGAGPLMGPVCAGAVILPEGCDIPGLDDSKKLTEKKREALYGVITERAIASKKYRNSLPIKLTLRYKDIFFPGIIRIGYFFLLDFQSPRPEEATESAELSAFFSFR